MGGRTLLPIELNSYATGRMRRSRGIPSRCLVRVPGRRHRAAPDVVQGQTVARPAE